MSSYWHTERRAKTYSSNCLLEKQAITAVFLCLLTNNSNCLLEKWAVTAVCLWAAGFSSAIEYWHTECRAKTNSCCLSVMQGQTAVTAYLKSEQLLQFVFELQDSLLPSSTGILNAAQRQTAVTAYLKREQLLLFVFQLQDSLLPSSTGILNAAQRQIAVTA